MSIGTFKYIFTRFREDISWIKDNSDIFENAIIYNKGEPLNIENEILTENVGLDARTPFTFILDNYDSLPDVCIFSQAKINDHFLHGEFLNADSLRKYKDEAFTHGESLETYIINDTCWAKDWNLHIGGHQNPDLYENKIVIPFIEWFNTNIDSKSTNVKRFHPCCIFSVSKKKILSRSKDYYENLHEKLNRSGIRIEPGFIERSWYHIFNPDYVEND